MGFIYSWWRLYIAAHHIHDNLNAINITCWPLSYFISANLKTRRRMAAGACGGSTHITCNIVFAAFMECSPLQWKTSAVLRPYAQTSVSCSVKEQFHSSHSGKPSSFLFTPGKWLGARLYCVTGNTHTHSKNGGKYGSLRFKGKYATEEACLHLSQTCTLNDELLEDYSMTGSKCSTLLMWSVLTSSRGF